MEIAVLEGTQKNKFQSDVFVEVNMSVYGGLIVFVVGFCFVFFFSRAELKSWISSVFSGGPNPT